MSARFSISPCQTFVAMCLMAVIISLSVVACDTVTTGVRVLPYPPGYDFAFTITDDPDDGCMEQKRVIYDFLDSLGMRTSIGVWVSDNRRGSGNLAYYHQGVSLQDAEFRGYMKQLQARGFELFLHTVTGGNDLRQETIDGFETYKRYFGVYPHHWVNHFTNYDNIYWGWKRFNNPLMQRLYHGRQPTDFQGDDPQSPYFWGDYCRRHIRYVRGWAIADLNTLKFNPSMPYHDPHKPYVRYWYACSDGADKDKFNRLIAPENVTRLIREHGTAIIYTHFARGFVDRRTDRLDETTKSSLSAVAAHKNGWFVPVNVILERLAAIREIEIREEPTRYVVVNAGDRPLNGLVLEVSDPHGIWHSRVLYRGRDNNPAHIVIAQVPSRAVIILPKTAPQTRSSLPLMEKIHLTSSWLFSRFY